MKALVDLYGRFVELPTIIGGNVQLRFLSDNLYNEDLKQIKITKVSIIKYPDLNDTVNSISCGYYDTKKELSIYDFCSNIPIEKLNKNQDRFYRFSFFGNENEKDCMIIIALKGYFCVNKTVRKINNVFK